jgi:SAM-dependent methyltransferase
VKPLDIERTFPEIEKLILDEDWWIFDGKKEIASSNCYNYYYSYAKSWKPQSILEIGVRRGYSAVSMAIGARENLDIFVGIDSEIDVEGSASFASNLLSNHTTAKIEILNFDTQQDDVSISDNPFDLIHIDADHSFLGCSSDLLLCLGLAKEGSIVIVDDALYAPVRAACEQIKSLYPDSLDVQYVTNFRGHCLVTVKRNFPELLSKQVRQSVLDTIKEIFPRITADKLIQEYSVVRNNLEKGEKGSVAYDEAGQKLLSDISFHLSELATSFQDRIKNYYLTQSTEQDLMSALTNLKQPMSSILQWQNAKGQGLSPKGILGFQGLVRKPSPDQKICKIAFAMLVHIEQLMLLLNSKPVGKCFSYFLGEASKHFSYLHERLYSKTIRYSSMEELSLSETKYAYASSERIQTFEGHGLAVVLTDALINTITSLNRELESQYWMGYWETKTNKTWTQMVLKEQEALLSPTPFPVKTKEEYNQFYGLQTINTAGGVSVKSDQSAEINLYRQLIQNSTDHAFRLATSICHIKMLLLLLQERHPNESIKWLDVGCGIGYIANKVGFDGEFVGIDVAEPLINYANETRFSERYKYLTGGFDEARNAIRGEKFHLITATEVVEHIFDPLDFVSQMKEHTCDLIYASSPLSEAVPHEPSQEHLWSFSLESYEQLFVLSNMKVTFSSAMYVGRFIGEGHNWLSVVATAGDVLRVFP